MPRFVSKCPCGRYHHQSRVRVHGPTFGPGSRPYAYRVDGLDQSFPTRSAAIQALITTHTEKEEAA